MAEPGAAGGRGHLRASHADREQVIEVLKVAFVQGRLTKDELDARVGQAFVSRTYAELATVTADIPAEAVAPRPRQAARPRRPGNATLKKGALVITAATVVTVSVWVAAVSTGVALLGALAFRVTVMWLGIVLLAGTVMLDSVLQKRPGGRLPPPRTPDAGDPAPRRAAPAGRAGELPPVDRAPGASAEAARRRPSRAAFSLGCAAEALVRSRCRRVAGQLR